MAISGRRLALLTLIALALIVSALLGTSAYAHDASGSASALGALR